MILEIAADVLVQGWRTVVIGLGAVVLGMAALVVWAYQGAAREGHVLPIHVTLIALSYALLVATGLIVLVGRLVQSEPPTFRLVLYPLAYVIGIVALTVVLRLIRERNGP